MDNPTNMHPQTVSEARSAALNFEYQGETAMRASGDQRAQLVTTMQSELQGMSPDERAKFYQNYNEGSGVGQSPTLAIGVMSMPPAYSSPNGSVERNASGAPIGIVFKPSAIEGLWDAITGRKSDEIEIKG
jgi:hypothetical protein